MKYISSIYLSSGKIIITYEDNHFSLDLTIILFFIPKSVFFKDIEQNIKTKF